MEPIARDKAKNQNTAENKLAKTGRQPVQSNCTTQKFPGNTETKRIHSLTKH